MARSPDEALAKASAHHAAGNHAQARPLYDEVLAADPNHPMALLRVAEQELAQGRADDAAGRVQRALNAARDRRATTPGPRVAPRRPHTGRWYMPRRRG